MRNRAWVLAVTGIMMNVTPSSGFSAETDRREVSALVAAANNAFAVDVYRNINTAKGNILFSPFSLASALAMTAEGACGATAGQMKKTMHLDRIADTDRRAAFRSCLNQMKSRLSDESRTGTMRDAGQEPCLLSVANDLWCQKGYAFKEKFLGIVKEDYVGDATALDFAADAEAARLVINAAVEEKTMRKVTDLLPRGKITKETRLVLTNAVHFKGEWVKIFQERRTKEAPFYLSNGNTVDVLTMRQENRFRYAETKRIQLLKMEYQGGDMSMVVILPKDREGLGELENTLTASDMERWIQALEKAKPVYMTVRLPRFKMSYDFSVRETLIFLGMKDAFNAARADFSGMTGNKDLSISEVLHKAYCHVNEKGTEAAAATAVVLTRGCAETKAVFNADHPFMYLILDDRNGMILFVGRMANPNEK